MRSLKKGDHLSIAKLTILKLNVGNKVGSDVVRGYTDTIDILICNVPSADTHHRKSKIDILICFTINPFDPKPASFPSKN